MRFQHGEDSDGGTELENEWATECSEEKESTDSAAVGISFLLACVPLLF
jgi:hypothetical protein